MSNGAGIFQPDNASSTFGSAFGGARNVPQEEFGYRWGFFLDNGLPKEEVFKMRGGIMNQRRVSLVSQANNRCNKTGQLVEINTIYGGKLTRSCLHKVDPEHTF
jgi:hypothetical protein